MALSSIIIWISIFAFIAVVILFVVLMRAKPTEDEELKEKLHEIIGDEKFSRLYDAGELKELTKQLKLAGVEKEYFKKLAEEIEKGDDHKIFPLIRGIEQVSKKTKKSAEIDIEKIKKELKHMHKVRIELAMAADQGINVDEILKRVEAKLIEKYKELQLEGGEKKVQEKILYDLKKAEVEGISSAKPPETEEELRELIKEAGEIIGVALTLERTEESKRIPFE